MIAGEATWPAGLAPRRVIAEVVASSLGAARTYTAIDDLADSGAEYWSIVFDEIPIASRAQKLALRTLSGLLNGRMGTCSVPIFDNNAKTIAASLHGAVSKGANRIVIRITDGSTLVPGAHFTAIGPSGQDRLYRIAYVVGIPVVGSGHVDWTVQIWPKAREAMVDTTSLNFATPTCICKLASDNEFFSAGDDYAARTLAKIGWTEYK